MTMSQPREPVPAPHPRIVEWRESLSRIEEELIELVRSKAIYEEVGAVIAANPLINRSNRFYYWISKNFCDSLLLGIRRQLDRDPRAISLMNLLNEIRKENELLNVSFHESLYRPDMVHLARPSFEKAIGSTDDYVPVPVIDADIATLQGIGAVHRGYTNKYVAHSDRDQAEVEPGTYGDLYAAVDSMESIFSKYYLLLCGADYRSLLPVPDPEWKAIFEVPWIPAEP